MSAAKIAKVLAGHRAGDGWLCRCPNPGHGKGRGDRNPSLLVKDGERALLLHCYGGCDARDILDELRRRGALDGSSPTDKERSPIHIPEPTHEPDAEATAVWHQSVPVSGTLGEKYLVDHRGVPKPVPPSIRFHDAVHYRPTGLSMPAIVAAVQAPSRQIIAVQVCYLRASDGAKAPVSTPRWTFGALGYGAVRLAAAGEVVGIAEGLETALSAQVMSGVPAWAALGGVRMHRVWIPETVRELHIFGDNDDPGRAAAERTAALHVGLGRRVVVRFPPESHKDWNDFLRAQEMVA